MIADQSDERPWPLRAVLLLTLGAAAGLIVHLLTRDTSVWSDAPFRLAAAAFVGGGFVTFAFSLERERPAWSAAFALAAALVIALVTWSNGPWRDWGGNEGWQLFSCALAITIAVPLFQAAREAGRPRLDYPVLHANAWTNIVLWCAGWGFVLVAFLLAQLLSELFKLIGIHLLSDWLREQGVIFVLIGGAFGAAVGLFRDRDNVLDLLQRVVTAVLSVLTPVLAAGLVIFVLSLPFTGLEPLWSQTKQTTPILLVCILGAFVLVNATIGSGAEEAERSPLLRYPAMALAVTMLPLGIVAAISLGKRIGQYGLTPERLWAGVFVSVALAAGLLYLVALVRRRRAWSADVRRFNTALAIGVCGLALLLALPILSFGAISARSQVARLEAGRVSPDKFDWTALRFDFGPAGRRAAERLARGSKQKQVRQFAAAILSRQNRYEASEVQQAAAAADRPQQLVVLPKPAAVPEAIRSMLFAPAVKGGEAGLCLEEGSCLLQWQPGESVAIAMHDRCGPYGGRREGLRGACGVEVRLLELAKGQWHQVAQQENGGMPYLAREKGAAQDRAVRSGKVEIRTVAVRQVYVDGQPVGNLFQAQPAAK